VQLHIDWYQYRYQSMCGWWFAHESESGGSWSFNIHRYSLPHRYASASICTSAYPFTADDWSFNNPIDSGLHTHSLRSQPLNCRPRPTAGLINPRPDSAAGFKTRGDFPRSNAPRTWPLTPARPSAPLDPPPSIDPRPTEPPFSATRARTSTARDSRWDAHWRGRALCSVC